MKVRSEMSTIWQPSGQNPLYLDSAYRQLLRQQLKATALKNRTQVLNLNQEHILKQVENNHSKLQRLGQVKCFHTQESEMLSRDKQKKSEIIEQQKRVNEDKRRTHEKQMSSIAIGKTQDRDKIREEAKRNRKENLKLIEDNRSQQLTKKREAHNKIHHDIMESRKTIQNFFANKHETILEKTQEEVKKLNQKRIKEELMSSNCSAKIVQTLQSQMKEMKGVLKDSRVGIELNRSQSSSNFKKKEVHEPHPLVRKIEAVLNQYTKFL